MLIVFIAFIIFLIVGMTGFLSKPIVIGDLVKELRKLL